MTPAPTERNRLDEAESPYLRQHADNPVNWQPWDEQALDAARERDVPIFLSIGYAACHWCHVMADESFADEAVAEVLNEQFVPIKVDREERPDLDSVYMSICQQVTGRGGWPLSAWLTPDGDPFYVGTYFPREEKRGMPAFPELCEDIAESWADPEQREDMEERARQWRAAIEDDVGDVPDQSGDPPAADALRAAADAAVRGADREYGGWGSGPKFPQPARLQVLARAQAREDAEGARAVLTETLDAMVDGGLFDHVGGGFHRYCTDREWVVPHFEKMLYDNAEISRALLTGYQVTGDDRYADYVERTFAFVERELTHPDGGFYSTLDAESVAPAADGTGHEAREEGAFYVWTPAEVREVVADERAADLFVDRYGVTERGNFEGATHLTVSASAADLAEEYDLDAATVRDDVHRAREQVREARAERPRPPRDEKILAGWNGLMITALAEGHVVLEDETYGERATDALAFAREHLWDADSGHLARRYKDGAVGIDGYLEDYAFLARGALACYEATGDVDHLDFALDLADAIVDEFWDAEDETLYFTPTSGEDLVARPQELTDQSTPASAAVATDLLLALDAFRRDDEFADVAGAVLGTHADRIRANPQQHPSFVLAADAHATGHLEVTMAADDRPPAWRETLAETYLPARLLAQRPPTADGLDAWLDTLGVADAPPIWADRAARDGEPTAYVCRSFACSPPEHDLSAALEWARENA